MSQCHTCGGEYTEDQMADWTICRSCYLSQINEIKGEECFLDSLGIAWTADELAAAGGKEEVERLNREAKI